MIDIDMVNAIIMGKDNIFDALDFSLRNLTPDGHAHVELWSLLVRQRGFEGGET